MPRTRPRVVGAPVRRLPTSVIGFVGAAEAGPVGTPVAIRSAEEYHATFGPSLDADQPLGHAVDLFFANGGRSAVVVRAEGAAPEQLVPDEGPGGVHALGDSGVTVLVAPGLTAAHPAQVRGALSWCAAYRAILLLDLAQGPWTAATGVALEEIEEHRERAAAYHPWVVVDGMSVPACGAVAGVVARSDRERGVWQAPSGVGLTGIDGLGEVVAGRQSEELARLGVNTLREFVGRGPLVWGARTLAAGRTAEPAQRYLNVRRFTDHVLASLTAGLTFVQQEPNDAALWSRVRQLTGDFLHELWWRGALQGSKPEQAYLTRCGLGETMTPEDVAAGTCVLLVGLAPVRPGEFDTHTLRLQAGMPVDLDGVVSRYIGETEKNLSRLFDRAEESGVVLVFDEADALFGRRTEVREAHDRYAGLEVSVLIERMARERGVPVRWRRGGPPPPP